MRVLIGIEGCEAHYDRFDAIMSTWASEALFWRAPHQVFVRFYTGAHLGVPDDYLSLPAKTKAICKVALLGEFDFIHKVDTDTYLSIPRLLASGFEQYDYSGFVTKAVQPSWLTYPYCCGPSYWLSRKAYEILASVNWDDYDNMDGLRSHKTDEDCMVGAILAHHGIEAHHDHRYVSPAGVLPDNDIISEHLSYRGPYTHEKMYQAHQKAKGS